MSIRAKACTERGSRGEVTVNVHLWEWFRLGYAVVITAAREHLLKAHALGALGVQSSAARPGTFRTAVKPSFGIYQISRSCRFA